MKTTKATTQRTSVADENAPWRFGHQQLKRLLENSKSEPRVIRVAIQIALTSMSNDSQDQQLDAPVTTANLTPADIEHVLAFAIEVVEDAFWHDQKHSAVPRTLESRALNLVRNALWLPLPENDEPEPSPEQTKRIAELVGDDWINTAWHEAGHVIVLLHYGYEAKADVSDSGLRRMDTSAIKGRTRWHNSPELSAFGISVFGWAGTIAEKLLEEPEADAGELWDACGSGDTSQLSGTDQCHIYSHHQIWRTFKTAARILSKHHHHVKAIAEALLKNHRWSSRTRKSEKIVASICGPISDTKR